VQIGIRTALTAEESLLLLGEATDICKAQQLNKEFKPDVLLLDLNLVNSTLSETITFLRKHHLSVQVLLLTNFSDIYISDVVAAGATGFVFKDEEVRKLVQAIHTVERGNIWFSQPISKKLAQQRTEDLSEIQEVTLTEREQQLLDLIARGWGNVRIATNLCLGEQTVRNYISRIYNKISVSSRSEAVIWAMKHLHGGVVLNSNDSS